ncbi:MAG TPA: acyltransferase [Elusimicrobiales bacterium]|nr:acyltransferase [Elusimicrobiales bacterium]
MSADGCSSFFSGPFCRFLSKGCKPKYFYFALKLLFYKILYRGRLSLSSFSVSFEPLCRLYVEPGARVEFGDFAYFKKGTDVEAYDGSTIKIGSNFFVNKNSSILSRSGITIGDNCVFAAEVMIYDHNFRRGETGVPFVRQGFDAKPIRIGNNVWLGARVFIGPGVTIGDNVIVGTGALVKKDIPANTIAYSKSELVFKPLN